MSFQYPPDNLAFAFGSELTILTTAAGMNHGKCRTHKGVFTGIVLDEADLQFRRGPKHISLVIDGWQKNGGQSKDAGYSPIASGGDEHGYEAGQNEDDNALKSQKHWPDKPKGKRTQEYIVLALTYPSFPFRAGQIVWISVKQIVGIAVNCCNCTD